MSVSLTVQCSEQRAAALSDDPDQQRPATRRKIIALASKEEAVETTLEALEGELEITERWDIDNEAFGNVMQEIYEWRWQAALKTLQQAIFSRMAELEKAHQAGTGT